MIADVAAVLSDSGTLLDAAVGLHSLSGLKVCLCEQNAGHCWEWIITESCQRRQLQGQYTVSGD